MVSDAGEGRGHHFGAIQAHGLATYIYVSLVSNFFGCRGKTTGVVTPLTLQQKATAEFGRKRVLETSQMTSGAHNFWVVSPSVHPLSMGANRTK